MNASMVSLGKTYGFGENITDTVVVCFPSTMITTNGIWQGDNPFNFFLPLFIVQLTLIVVTTRTLVFLLKPFRQPRVIAEIIGGILLGPSFLGRNEKYATLIFPLKSVTILETMANLGLLYFLFLVGVEMDPLVIKKQGRKSLMIALSGMFLPFAIGTSTSIFLRTTVSETTHEITFLLFLGVVLSITAFPVLARILAELKLLNTDLGRLAMSAAVINDIFAWIVLAMAVALTENAATPLASLWVILSGLIFVLFCVYVVRPMISWLIRQTPEGEPVGELTVCIILTGVMVSGFVTDALGIHSIFGSFVFGLMIPNGQLGGPLVEKLEDFISGLLLPLFFAISGLRTDIRSIKHAAAWGFLVLVIMIACVGKIVGTLLISLFYKMPFREGLSLGLLMNTKGLIEMIVLNVGRDQKVLDEQAFAVMVIMGLVMTSIITPIITAIYRPSRHAVPYKRRTIEQSKPDAEFRILTCIHSPRNVPTIINLLEASYATKKSPLVVYALHLVELTGRASAMLIVHTARKTDGAATNSAQAQSNHIAHAFEQYESTSTSVSVQPLTAISPYSTMHEDICNLAEEKRVGFIILPFHKQQTVDGSMESTNPSFRGVNQNVLSNAPCSVGILVDRGLGGKIRPNAPGAISHQVAVLFFGGPDDRESLAYASRMAEHPGINLTILRFLPGENVSEPSEIPEDGILTIMTDIDRERQLDDDFMNEFRMLNVNNERLIYKEHVVNTGEETVSVIRGMDGAHDLFVVGRGQGTISPLTSGLTAWSECPELGPIGDLLSSSDFTSTVSVLVVQQYIGSGSSAETGGMPNSPGPQMDHYFYTNQQQSTGPPDPAQRRGDVGGTRNEWNDISLED